MPLTMDCFVEVEMETKTTTTTTVNASRNERPPFPYHKFARVRNPRLKITRHRPGGAVKIRPSTFFLQSGIGIKK